MNVPRCAVTLNCRPSSACAAVAPRQTMARGLTSAISVSSQGRHAAISAGVRFLVDAPLPARFPLEVFHDVRDVDAGSIDAGVRERTVQQLAGGPDKRMARQVFLIARLLADEHQLGLARAFAEDRLCPEFPEIAAAAVLGRLADLRERRALGDELSRAADRAFGHRPPLVAAILSRATATLRRRPCTFVRRIGLPRSAAASSSSLCRDSVRRSTRSQAERGCHARSSDRGAAAFHGQTS